eukprot:1995520-Rhodomonas_salina.4
MGKKRVGSSCCCQLLPLTTCARLPAHARQLRGRCTESHQRRRQASWAPRLHRAREADQRLMQPQRWPAVASHGCVQPAARVLGPAWLWT